MRYACRLVVGFIVTGVIALMTTPAAADIPDTTTQPAPELPTSPLKISAYGVTPETANGAVVGSGLRYVELYNTSKEPVAVDGWQLTIGYATRQGNAVTLTTPETVAVRTAAPGRYIPPGQYGAIDLTAAIDGTSLAADQVSPASDEFVKSISLVHARYAPATATLSDTQFASGQILQKRLRTLGGSTYDDDTSGKLYDQGLYAPLPAPAVQVVEILANPRTCAPADTDPACQEYVKLYNPDPRAVQQLAGYRLRVGAQGQSSTASNTVTFGAADTVAAGSYALVPVSLTNTGAYVWLEDSYGITSYAGSVVEYPDASATSKKGLSWALGNGAIWNWALPQPAGPNNLLSDEQVAAVELGLTPCRDDQFRNPTTNRCKKIDVATEPVACAPDQERNPATNRCRKIASSSLTPCDADEYRSPETNRCRKLASSTGSLTPCKPGQYRSPETNRCRSTTAATSELKPCAPGQERNPDTNRCRKAVSGDGNAGYKVVPTPASSTDQALSWLALGGLGAASLGYAGWEWRRDLMAGVRKLLAGLPFIK